MPRRCAVCARKASDFNYGVQTCNACKMFFRRHVVRTVPLKRCAGLEQCYEITPNILDCQFCRFQKCIQVGMKLEPLLHKTSSSELIDSISKMETDRSFTLLNCYPLHSNLDVSTVISHQIQYTSSRPAMNFQSWSYISTVSTIDFMKQFPFVYFSKLQDQQAVVKAYFIGVASLCEAYRAYSNGSILMSFPDGSNIFPANESGNKELKAHIRYRLVEKLMELRITHEEFLLILVILCSNPATPHLSRTARILCSSYRDLYSSVLFEYCMQTYQKYGPIRFAELLSILNVIAKHYEDVNRYFVLLQLSGQNVQMDGIVKEGLDLL